MWPIFVYSLLHLVADHYPELARKFYEEHSKAFARDRTEDLCALEFVRHPDHIDGNATAKTYRNNKYRLTLTYAAFYSLIQFLEINDREGGSVINSILQNALHIVTVDRAASGGDRAFAAILAKKNGENDVPDEDEGIPGHNPGSANTERNAPPVLTRLSLGPLPMDTELATDVRDELEDEDTQHPPKEGQQSLLETLDKQIKRESSEEAPNRETVPLPRPVARDVAMEVLKVREYRDRLKLGSRTGGIGPGISVTMFTFHNTFDSVNCIVFSGDSALVAIGTSESYIRVWSLDGKPLPSLVTDGNSTLPPVSSSRRLIGHSGPIYGLSFSPSSASAKATSILTKSRYLLSSSADKSVRLWSLDTWSCLVIYKGHDHPVWDITWGPFGHYFLTGSHDTTARLWSTDQIAPLRIFAGHDQDVDCVAFHPNNAYVFTGSSDKTVRMWDINRGSAVRIFTGHMSSITAIACAPSGKTLASADDSGAIMIWDLATGRRMKRMRGHNKGGVCSLSWSVESSLLVSGGADGTVRIWDVLQKIDGLKAPGEAGSKDGTTNSAAPAVSTAISTAAGKHFKTKDAAVTADQISAFPTKKSPVYRVKFTNMNLVLAGGAYMP